MIINIMASMNLIITLTYLIIGVTLVDRKSIETILFLNMFKNEKSRFKSKSNQNRLYRVISNINKRMISNKAFLVIESAFYQLLRVKPFSIITNLEEYIFDYFLIKFNKKEEANIYCLTYFISVVKRVIFGNLVGTIIAIKYHVNGKSNIGIVAYILIMALVITILYIYIDKMKELKKKRVNMINDELPKLVLKLIMLCNSGMSLNDAFFKAVDNNFNFFYQNMKIVYSAMEDGETYLSAANQIISRYKVKDLSIFFRMLTQAQKQGSYNYLTQLEKLRVNLAYKRINKAKNKSSVTDAKLLLPLSLIFVGIMIIIIVPIFMSIL